MLKNFSFAPKVIQDTGSGKGTGWYKADGSTVIDENGNVVGTIVPSDIPLVSAHILVGNSSNLATSVVLSGDSTITNAGVIRNSRLSDTNGVGAVLIGTIASAVNQLTITDSATGAVTANAVVISATGTDAAVSLAMVPKGVTGIFTLGLSNGTGDIVLGQSTATQAVRIGHGVGAATVSIANQSLAGALVNIAGAVTGAGITDTVTVAAGNAAATGLKVVNILTGTPGTSGNNRLTMGGGATSAVTVNGVATSYTALNRTTGSAVANAPVATLVDASGNNITVAAGLRIVLTLAAGLQAGANTLNLNGHGADSVKSHRNPATDIAAAYVTTGQVDLLFNGTVWLDMSQ